MNNVRKLFAGGLLAAVLGAGCVNKYDGLISQIACMVDSIEGKVIEEQFIIGNGDVIFADMGGYRQDVYRMTLKVGKEKRLYQYFGAKASYMDSKYDIGKKARVSICDPYKILE